jgi:putative hydrolase of the HAD superfamily
MTTTSAQTGLRDFATTDTWIFDLDNTLYPASCNLFDQVDHKMGAYIERFLGVPYGYARHLQKSYYRQFGTTLAGLMQVHQMPPGPFLDFVHDIDVSHVPEAPELRAAIARLPGRKLIFTNGTVRHAENVAGKLGVLDQFEAIYDIVAADYVPKPQRAPYDKFLARHAIDPSRAAMFEDMPRNLEAPHALGMTTVLVHAETPLNTPRAAHIHHATDDLATFLNGVTAKPQ